MQIRKRWNDASAVAIGLSCILILVIVPTMRAQNPPVYEVDPTWPKPLPNKWLMQGVPVMVTDKDDHIWVFNRPRDINPDESGAATKPPRTDCCIAAPAVLEFDTTGNLIKGWGGPGYVPGWPAEGIERPGAGAEHAILVDREGNVWLGGSARGDSIQKFTGDGKLLWDFGHRGPRTPPGQQAQSLKQTNQDTDIFPGGIFFFDLDEDAHELYIVDQKRVLVYDMDSGAFKRGWGGHGILLSEIDNDPTPPYDWKSGPPPDQKQFAPALHCVHIATDGLVYICERGSDRVQVFTKEGKFVSSFFVHPSTPSRGPECGGPGSTTFGMCGTIYNLTFSHDPQQKYVLIADGTNDKIWIHDRKDGSLAGSIGDNGRMAGQFHWIDAIAMDSKGNIYTGEVDTGKRAQKFVLKNGDGKARPHPHGYVDTVVLMPAAIVSRVLDPGIFRAIGLAEKEELLMPMRMEWSGTSAIVITLSFIGMLALCPAARAQKPPEYKVDPFWPKRLPNNWSMQQIVDIYVDKEDHVWVINRASDARPDELGASITPPRTECCIVGPEIVEFDTDGSVLKAWGGKDYVPGWPGRLQTIGVDRDENVWISGTTPGDSIIKFNKDGKFLWDFGHRGPKVPASEVKQNNQQTDIFPPGIAAFEFDEDARELYIPDGFLNKRVLVYDMDTGAFKRGWGGKGTPLSEIDNDPTPPYDPSGPPPDQKMFAPALHCAHPSKDGFVYVCERGSDRIQVFTKQGKFVKQFWIHPSTQSRGPHCGGIWSMTDPPCGTIYNLTLSTDPQQKYILVADGTNNMVWILNRDDGALVRSFGGNGRYAGQLHWIDSIAMDSKGNVYTGEVEDGKRIQKFVPVK